MNLSADHQALIRFITWRASREGAGVTRIRLIKFLYLADVHAFARRQLRATAYPWRFYHYGPWALEAQRDIEECAKLGLIHQSAFLPTDEAGEIVLYSATGIGLHPHAVFDATLEVQLEHEIDRWLREPLNLFLNYIYFETPPMREARRGDVLRFDAATFSEDTTPEGGMPRPRTSAAARTAFHRLLRSARESTDRVPVPHDAKYDEAFEQAIESLDAQDRLAGPLNGIAEARPDALG